jgi:hypothetical protein
MPSRREMNMPENRTRTRIELLFTTTLALAGLLAAPAQAGGNEFDDGFQDQLGRMVATEAFFLGKWILASAYGYAVHDPSAAADDYDFEEIADDEWDGGDEAARDYDAPCELEYRERVRRDRYGEVVEYERREVCRRRTRYDDWED